VTPSQIHAAAELYFIYQNERMKVFQVVDVLRRLFALGRMKIQRGPGARGLYILEKWKPLRYSRRDRMIAYRRVFNYGNVPAPQGAVVNATGEHPFAARRDEQPGLGGTGGHTRGHGAQFGGRQLQTYAV
jgi:hypothetical protein